MAVMNWDSGKLEGKQPGRNGYYCVIFQQNWWTSPENSYIGHQEKFPCFCINPDWMLDLKCLFYIHILDNLFYLTACPIIFVV